MESELSNGVLNVRIKHRGAELCSIRSSDGTEWMWQADPAVWGRHAPVLFPIVGRLAGDEFSVPFAATQGRAAASKFSLTQHGFARDSEFVCGASNSQHSAEFVLTSDSATMARFPFAFELRVCYSLPNASAPSAPSSPSSSSPTTLKVRYDVLNTSTDAKLPFCLGAHPAFALGGWGGGDVSDYFLAFGETESPGLTAQLLEGGLLSDRQTSPLLSNNELTLSSSLFDNDALIFLHHRSRSISLRSRAVPDRGVTVSFERFPHLGIWAKPGGAKFVCIEPWCGHADPLDGPSGAPRNFFNKPGISVLEPGEHFVRELFIQIKTHH